MRSTKTVLALICWLLPALAIADPVLEGRVERLERILSNQSLSDLVLQIQRLEQELQTLRGQVELQQHELNTLKSQRQQPTDLDAQQRGGTSAGSSPPSAAAAVTAPPPQSPPAAATAPPTASAAPAEGEEDAYTAAFDLLKQRQYDQAIRAFQDQLARWPAGELADNARYWLGETYYVKRDYPAALTEFQRVLSEHPGSQKAAGALLKVGYIHHDLGELQQARTTLLDVITLYPDSTESRLAQSRLDRIAKEAP